MQVRKKKRKYQVSCNSLGENSLVHARGHREMTRLVHADRKTTTTQITAIYNRGGVMVWGGMFLARLGEVIV